MYIHARLLKCLIHTIPLLLLFMVSCTNRSSTDVADEPEAGAPVFTFLSPEQTRIDFQNTLEEGLNTNILMYEYFYNGGGVAAGDLNGDDLIDLYFTSNMGSNKLYINQGNMQFKDVTSISGATGRPGPWKTGVAMADINGDGLLDIYVCYSGALPDDKRVNQLFINKGTGTGGTPLFREAAAEYGLDSPAFSNQAYFFDYDRDGDLDMILLNHNPKNLPVLNEVSTAQMLQKDDPLQGVRLYRQNDGRFEDATQEAGISSSALTYGLGVGISDINGDGWPDFYISNDYAVPDYLYINQQDGTFSDELAESMGHNSHFSMGNDVADINNDGLQDIVTLDMLPEDNYRQKLLLAPDNYAKFDLNVRSGFNYQYMRNMLQLNNGDGTFSEIGQLAGISNTDWSWAALLADYNNDGWKDLMITNGYLRDYTNLDFIKYMDDFVQEKGRLVREDVLEIISHMPASNVVNYMFVNDGGHGFTNKTKAWGLDRPSNSNGAAYADLDNDGDLDLVINNINQPAFILQNESRRENDNHYLQLKLEGAGANTNGIGARVQVFSGDQQQSLEQYPSRGYLSAVSPVLHFGLGSATQVDRLVITWNNGKSQEMTNVPADQVLVLKESDASGSADGSVLLETPSLFTQIPAPVDHIDPVLPFRDFDRQHLLISELSYSGPVMAAADVNQDGLEDLFIGGTVGRPGTLYLRQRNGNFSAVSVQDLMADAASDDAAVAFFDANGDDYPDLYVGSGGYHDLRPDDPRLQDRLYLNDGGGHFTKATGALPDIYSSTGSVAVQDVNADGFPDLFIGGRMVPGRYPESPGSYLLINDGKGRFSDQTGRYAPELQQLGMVTDAAWTDLNGDASPELIVVGEWMPVTVYSLQDGRLVNKTAEYFDQEYKGLWNTLEVEDLNGDQRPDLVIGNMGTNTQFQVSVEEPAELYYKDFDGNGSVDPIFSFYIQGQSYPYVTRDEMLGQLSRLRSRYTTFESYANATVADIFASEELRNAGHLEANYMKTALFLSGADGKLEAAELPIEAQYSPVYTITVIDADGDGIDDVLLCGNNSHAKLRLGKMDANYGVLLRGDGRGGFTYVPQLESGFSLRGDVRSAVQIKDILLFGMNEGKVESYKRQYREQ
jgi:hypothetical protein